MIKTPILDAPPIPAKKLKGIEITSAHGQDTTKNDNALYNHSVKFASFIIISGTIAIITANITTTGV